MTTQELIKQLRSDAHYLANDEIAFNAVISKRIDLAVDCLKVLETQLIKTEEARQKQGKRLSEERKQKYDQITVIDELKNQLATVAAERDKAVEDLKNAIILPCKIGDTVYTNTAMQGWHMRKKDRPYAAKIVFIGINGVDNIMNVVFKNDNMLSFPFSQLGETVFLTREEAEQVLKERS